MNSGVILSVGGSVVDVRFDDYLPPIYAVLRAGDETSGFEALAGRWELSRSRPAFRASSYVHRMVKTEAVHINRLGHAGKVVDSSTIVTAPGTSGPRVHTTAAEIDCPQVLVAAG